MGVFTEEDHDRLRNHLLSALVVRIKRICRFSPDREQAVRSLEAILDAPFYREALSRGFRRVPPVPGVKEPSPTRRRLDAVTLRLLERRRFGALIFFVTRLYRAR